MPDALTDDTTSPEWLTVLAGVSIDRLIRWEDPRSGNLLPSNRRAEQRRNHFNRFRGIAADPDMPTAEWVPLPEPKPGTTAAAAGGGPDSGGDPTPDHDTLTMLAATLRRNPGYWAVLYAGNRSCCCHIKHLVQSSTGGFDPAGQGYFTALVRSDGNGLFQIHVRFTRSPGFPGHRKATNSGPR